MEEIDIHDFKEVEELGNRWGKDFLGWTLNENEHKKALFLRVPKKYFIFDKEVEATEEQLFFNEIRIPISDTAVTLYLKRAGGQEWEIENDFFERCEEKIKKALSEHPKYLQILNDVSCGRISVDSVEKLTNGIIEVWK